MIPDNIELRIDDLVLVDNKPTKVASVPPGSDAVYGDGIILLSSNGWKSKDMDTQWETWYIPFKHRKKRMWWFHNTTSNINIIPTFQYKRKNDS